MSAIVSGSGAPNNSELSVRAALGEGVEHFVNRWAIALMDAYNASEFVVAGSGTLATTWVDSNGIRTHVTSRNTDEGDDAFFSRHTTDTINDMAGHPPIP